MELVQLENQKQSGGMMEVAISRQAQEVQAAMVIAQRFPRDTNRSFTRVMEDCKRRSLAEKAVYSYPRGKETVSGPSIRLAEAIAKAWGNLDFGVVELERKAPMGNNAGESVVMAYAWDLETNTRSQKVFTVLHRRNTKQGSYNITDERDIYEMVANNAARRLRASILSVVPADIVEKAVDQCRLSLKSSSEPIVDRIRKMVVAFKDQGVSQEMLEARLGHKLDVTTADELVELQQIYNSIRDGQADRSDFFEMSSNNQGQDVVQKDEDKKPEQEPKSLKPKNHAPQSSEEAQKQNAEREKQRAQQSTSEKTTTKEAAPSRANLINEVLELQKSLNMSAEDFRKVVFEQTNKQLLKDVTSNELEMVILRLYAIAKEQQGGQ